jgi:transcriptional regulator with XRE-family HTH domain
MSGIGEKIRAAREAKGLSRKAFGARTGVPEAKVQAVEIGKQRADHEFLMSIVRNIGVDANWLLSEPSGFGEGEAETARIAPASGGDWVHVDESDLEAKGWLGLSQQFLVEHKIEPKDLLFVSVVGSGMEPRLADGDQVLVNCAETELKDGQTFVVRFADDLIVKQVQVLPQAHVQLVSANADFPPILVDLNDTDMAVIGRVVMAVQLL